MRISNKLGFTLVEVTLFLALSSSIMLGIILATNNSVARQRYNDSVNDFADFLRGIYSKVIDVEHNSEGNSGEAVYGKFVTFQESRNSNVSNGRIKVYNVVGNAVNSSSHITGITAIDILLGCDADGGKPICGHLLRDADGSILSEEYRIPWTASLEKPNEGTIKYNCPSDTRTYSSNHGDIAGCFSGAILVIRSPLAGNVVTYTSTTRFSYSNTTNDPLVAAYRDGYFSISDLDFCVDSDDNNYSNRRNIRLLSGGVNSSAVYMVEQDDEGKSRCLGR